MPAVARFGNWSPDALRTQDAVNIPLSIAAGVLLMTVLTLMAGTVVRYVRWARQLARELDEHGGDGVVILPGDEPLAFSAPGRGGRIAISSGMLAALNPKERCALLAHERAHLALRHHLFLVTLTLSSTLNPLLRPLTSAAGFALERWADETAARHLGDRKLVARAVAKAALAGRPPRGFAMAATGGPVPQRVSALLAQPAASRVPAALLGALVLGIAALSAESAADSAVDLHDGIEIAQAATPAPLHHHRHLAETSGH